MFYSNLFTKSVQTVLCCPHLSKNGTSKWCIVACKCAMSCIHYWAILCHAHMPTISRMSCSWWIKLCGLILHLSQPVTKSAFSILPKKWEQSNQQYKMAIHWIFDCRLFNILREHQLVQMAAQMLCSKVQLFEIGPQSGNVRVIFVSAIYLKCFTLATYKRLMYIHLAWINHEQVKWNKE